MRKPCLLRQAALLLLLRLGSATAPQAWTPKSYPNPTLDPEACGRPGIISWICDADSLLTKREADTVEGILKDIAAPSDPFEGPDCPQLPPGRAGFQVGAAVMRKMALQGRSQEQAAEDFATALFNQWGPGLAACRNGAILLLSIEDRQVYIRTGQGRLSPQRIASVIDRMRPLLRSQQYGEALRQGVVDLGIALTRQAQGKSEQGQAQGKSEQGQLDFTPYILLACFGGLGSLFVWKNWKKRSDETRVRSLLQRLQAEQATARQQRRYPAATCPICFEDLQQPGTAPAEGLKAPEPTPPSAPPLPQDSEAAGPSSAEGSDDVQNPLLRKTRAEQSAQSGTAAPAAARKPLGLPCGHTFCEPCMETWLSSNRSCPVCRQPADRDRRRPDDDDGDTPQGPPGPSRRPPPPDPCSAQSQTQQQRPQRLDDAMWQAELAYRLHGMHRMYPDIITTRTRDRWLSQAESGRQLDMQWDTVRADLLSQAAQSQQAYSGSSGQSYGFGGGAEEVHRVAVAARGDELSGEDGSWMVRYVDSQIV